VFTLEITDVAKISGLLLSTIKSYALILTRTGCATIKAIFSQTHPVTLPGSTKVLLPGFAC
jgi:hypothetical protein